MTDDVFRSDSPAATDRLHQLAAIVSGALVAFGFLCWIAANWATFHRFTKLELVGAALLASSLVALLAPRVRPPALIVAVAAVGGLLALLGQIYPSGVDAWQLFAFWAALALPFALAARHDAVWSLWAVVASVGIVLWRTQALGTSTALVDWVPAWTVAVALAASLCPTTRLTEWIGSTRWAFRAAALGAVILVTGDAIIRDSHDLLISPALLILGGGSAALVRLRPLDLSLLAAMIFAIDLLLVWRVVTEIAPGAWTAETALVIGLVAAGIVAGSVVILRHIARTAAPVPAPMLGGSGPSFAWPLALLSGIGAIIAAVPLIAFYALAFTTLIKTASGAAIIGLFTLVPAIVLLRGSNTLGFRQLFGVIIAVVGLAMIGKAAFDVSEKNAGFLLCAVATAVAASVPERWARTVFGFAANVAFIIAILMHGGFARSALLTYVTVAGSAAALGAAHLGRNPLGGEARSFLFGWTTAGLCALLVLAGQPFLLGASKLAGLGTSGISVMPVTSMVSIALTLGASILLFLREPELRGIPAIALVLAAAVMANWVGALGPAAAVLVCAILIGSRTLGIAAALTVLWIVSATCYALGWTLTQKAWTMIALGMLVGGAVAFARRRVLIPSAPFPVEHPVLPRALIACGLLLTGGMATATVTSAEEIMQSGRQIFIALRPVDPRSLLQGDYMALTFDTSRLPQPKPGNDAVQAIAELDDRGVATLALPRDDAPDAAIPVTLRTKGRRWFVGSDAWFFEEGQDKRLAAARFGVFRVGSTGRLLLVGLADGNLQMISAAH